MEIPLTGKKFKDKVRGYGILLDDFAKEAKVSPATASSFYNGKDIYLSTYTKLIEALHRFKAEKQSNQIQEELNEKEEQTP